MRFLLTIIALLALSPLRAAEVTVLLSDSVDLDAAGRSLRQALNAWEAAQKSSLPQEWTRLDIAPGESKRYGPDLFLLLPKSDDPAGTRLLVVNGQDANRVAPEPGAELTAGPLALIVLAPPGREAPAKLLIRSAEPLPLLLTEGADNSPTRISGGENPRRLVIESPGAEAPRFARAFLNQLNKGESPEAAARAAREAVPPASMASATAPPTPEDYTDPTNFALPDESGDFSAAMVTLRLVRGDAASVGQLASDLSYSSQGRSPSDPAIGASSGPEGGTVTIGRPGDRFRAALRALERNGEVNTESETYVRVALGGDSHFDLQSSGHHMSASVSAQRRGRDAVQLRLFNQQGDWGQLGRLNTTARVRDGQTVLLARNNYQRRQQTSSGVPILQDLPFLGPVFGSSARSNVTQSYALFATVTFEE